MERPQHARHPSQPAIEAPAPSISTAPASAEPSHNPPSLDKKAAFKDMLRQRQAEVRTNRASSAALSDARSRRSTTTGGYSADRGYHYSHSDYREGHQRGLSLQSLREEASRNDNRAPYQSHRSPANAGIVIHGPEIRYSNEIRQDPRGGIVIRGPEVLPAHGHQHTGSQDYTQRWHQEQRLETAPYGSVHPYQERRVSQEAQDLRDMLLTRRSSGPHTTQDQDAMHNADNNNKARASTATTSMTSPLGEKGQVQGASTSTPDRRVEITGDVINFRSREAEGQKFVPANARPPATNRMPSNQALEPFSIKFPAPPLPPTPPTPPAPPAPPANGAPHHPSGPPPATTELSPPLKMSVYNPSAAAPKNVNTPKPAEQLPKSTKFSNAPPPPSTFKGPSLTMTVDNSNYSRPADSTSSSTQAISTKFSGPSTTNTSDPQRTGASDVRPAANDDHAKRKGDSPNKKDDDNASVANASGVSSTTRRAHPDPDGQEHHQQASKRARVGGDTGEAVNVLSLSAIREERASKDPKLAKKMEEAEKAKARLEELTKAREMAMEVIKARERAIGVAKDREPARTPPATNDRPSGWGNERGSDRRPERGVQRDGDRRGDRGYEGSSDRYSDRNYDRAPSNYNDRRYGKGYDREPERSRDRGSERGQDRDRDRGNDRGVSASQERPAEKSTEKPQDKGREKVVEKEGGRESASPQSTTSAKVVINVDQKEVLKQPVVEDSPVLFAGANRMQAKAGSTQPAQQPQGDKAVETPSQAGHEEPIIFSSAGRAQQQQQQQQQQLQQQQQQQQQQQKEEKELYGQQLQQQQLQQQLQQQQQQPSQQQPASATDMDVDVVAVKPESPILFSSASRLQQTLESPILFAAASRANGQGSPLTPTFGNPQFSQTQGSLPPFVIGSSTSLSQGMPGKDFAAKERSQGSSYFKSNGLNMVSTPHGDVGRSDMSLAFEVIDRCTIDLQQLQQRHAAVTSQLSEVTFKALESDARLAQLAAQMELEMKMNHIHQEIKRGFEQKQLPELQRMMQATHEMILRLSQLSASAAAGSATAVVVAPKLGSAKAPAGGGSAGSGTGTEQGPTSTTSPAALALVKLAESGHSWPSALNADLNGAKKRESGLNGSMDISFMGSVAQRQQETARVDFIDNGAKSSSGSGRSAGASPGEAASVERVLIRPCLSFNIAPKGCRFTLNNSPCPYMHTCLYCGSVDHPVLQCDYTSVEPSQDGIFKRE